MFSLYSSSNIVMCIALDRLRNVMYANQIHTKTNKVTQGFRKSGPFLKFVFCWEHQQTYSFHSILRICKYTVAVFLQTKLLRQLEWEEGSENRKERVRTQKTFFTRSDKHCNPPGVRFLDSCPGLQSAAVLPFPNHRGLSQLHPVFWHLANTSAQVNHLCSRHPKPKVLKVFQWFWSGLFWQRLIRVVADVREFI